MKKILVLATIILGISLAFAQTTYSQVVKDKTNEDRNFRIPLIGELAPSFTAESTNGTINFPSDYGNHWKILFSHPRDFTPVCSTEIMELAQLQKTFKEMGVEPIVISVDRLETHIQWKKGMESVALNNRKPVDIEFPLVDDNNLVISKLYGMIHPENNTSRDVRGIFIIDPNDIIQAIFFYPMNVGRNTDEVVRLVTALQTTSNTKEQYLTPVNWRVGDDILVAGPPEVDKKNPNLLAEKGYYNPVWFLWYKKAEMK